VNIFVWLKNFKVDDQDLAFMENLWKTLEKRGKRDQGLVIKCIDLIITRFLLVARHREDVVRRGTREDRKERADAIAAAIASFNKAHREMRQAFWAYHEALPDVFTAENMKGKNKNRGVK
jgi:hypothetical protein